MTTTKKSNDAEVVRLEVPDPTPAAGAVIGRVVEASGTRDVTVDYPGNAQGPQAAVLAIPGARVGVDGLTEGAQVVLLFEGGAPQRPIVVGIVQTTLAAVEAEIDRADAVARVDGKRVELEGKEEVVLKCGKASITLRRNGRVVIKGTYVETRSAGVNRIKGGSVLIN